MKRSIETNNYRIIDEALKLKLLPLLYDNGLGKHVSIAELVLHRNKQKPEEKLVNK